MLNKDVSLSEISKRLNEKMKKMWEAEHNFVLQSAPVDSAYLKSLREIPLSSSMKTKEIILPVAGDVSAGKSSVLCSVCKYPIIPAAVQTTSICAVEIRKVFSYDEEKIEICLLTDDKTALNNTAVKEFKKQRLSEELFNELKDYSLSLFKDGVLSVEDTLDFFMDKNGDFSMTPDNWRHSMVLLMILFDAYVYQDNPDKDASTRAINDKRSSLFKALGVPLNKDYGIKLYWNSEFIPENTAIVDLPGTGSATEDSGNMAGHTKLVTNYTSQAPSLLFLIGHSGLVGSSDAKNVIDTFLTTNEIKGACSARLTFVINKADILIEGSQDNSKVITTIKTFRRAYSQKFPSYDKYPVYTISARGGEINYLESGISCRNTHIASIKVNELNNTLKKIGITPTEEMLDTTVKDTLQENYNHKFPYQLSSDEDFGEMNLGEFFKKFFFECAERIRFLEIIKNVENHISVVEKFLNTLIQEKTMAETVKKFGKECAENLSAAIREAMEKSIEEIMGQLNTMEEKMDELFAEMKDRYSAVCKRFYADYKVLSKKINDELLSTVSSMEKQKNGEIPIDGNLLGTNKIGCNNLMRLKKFCERIAEYDFISYFKDGFNKLKYEISLEKDTYETRINKICEILNDFPDMVTDKMEKEFALITKDKPDDVVLSYKEAVENAKKTTKRLLASLCSSVASAIRQDTSVREVIDETLQMIQEAFLELFIPYTNKKFYNDFLNSVSKSRFFRANVISVPNLKIFIGKQYLNKFEEDLNKRLDEILLGENNTATSHISRIKTAIFNVNKTHISVSTFSKLTKMVEKACVATSDELESPAFIVGWFEAINNATDNLGAFLGENSFSVYFDEKKDEFNMIPWLNEEISLLSSRTEPLKNDHRTLKEEICTLLSTCKK